MVARLGSRGDLHEQLRLLCFPGQRAQFTSATAAPFCAQPVLGEDDFSRSSVPSIASRRTVFKEDVEERISTGDPRGKQEVGVQMTCGGVDKAPTFGLEGGPVDTCSDLTRQKNAKRALRVLSDRERFLEQFVVGRGCHGSKGFRPRASQQPVSSVIEPSWGGLRERHWNMNNRLFLCGHRSELECSYDVP